MENENQNTSIIKVNTGLAHIEKQIAITNKLLSAIDDLKTVTIGNQVWSKENLNVNAFRNGDLIPEAQSNEEWKKASDEGKPAWCHYYNDPANGTKYGKLYNWFAVKDSRRLAPEGWHIPSDKEWDILVDYLGGDEVGYKMKNISGWGNGYNGDNSSGFSAFPGGYRNLNGSFDYIGQSGYFWSGSEGRISGAWHYDLRYNNSDMSPYSNGPKGCGFSVRCVRD